MVVSVKLRNIKKHKDIELNLNGNSVAFVGESRTGKSTVIQIIKSHLGISDYPKDGLTEGEEDGSSEIVYADDVTGKKYTVTRKYTGKKLQRFDMRTEDNGKLNWQNEIKELFNGVDPKIVYFDYAEFFFQQKTPETRFEYAMRSVLGDLYVNNEKEAEQLEKERGTLGTKRKLLETRLLNSEITIENLQELDIIYKDPKVLDKAKAERQQLLDTRPNIQLLMEQLKEVTDANEKYVDMQNTLHVLNNETIPGETIQVSDAAKIIEVINNMLTVAEQMNFSDAHAATIDEAPLNSPVGKLRISIESTVDILRKQLAEMETQKSLTVTSLESHKKYAEILAGQLADLEYVPENQQGLQFKLDKAAEDIERIEKLAQSQYEAAAAEIEHFNAQRLTFLTQKQDFEDLQLTLENWIEKDNQVKDLRTQNIRAFKEKVPFEGLEIKDIITAKKVGDETVETVKQHLYYNGRELNRDNVSTGESLEITYQFQTVHNPRLKVVFIPDAQSLGGYFYDLAIAAQEKGFQWIAEFTELKKGFEMKFSEEFLKRYTD
jgi:hypothetical protein